MRRMIIYNPRARATHAARLSQAADAKLAGNGGYELKVPRSPNEATSLARQAAQDGYDQVIAAGGDGTINAVVEGLVGSQTALGIVPLGTGNAAGSNLDLRAGDIAAAMDLIVQGNTRRVDLGRMNGCYFLTMGGVGLDAHVAHELHHAWKRRLGKIAFIRQFFRSTLSYKLPHCHLEITGGEDDLVLDEPLWAVLICNMPIFTWRVNVAPNASPDDGQLDFIIFHRCSVRQLVSVAGDNFLFGVDISRHPYVTIAQGKHMQITAEPPAYWQADGDVGGQTPVTAEVVPAALDLIVP